MAVATSGSSPPRRATSRASENACRRPPLTSVASARKCSPTADRKMPGDGSNGRNRALPGREGLRPLSLPLATFAAAICNSSFTSTPVVRFAQIAGVAELLGERAISNPLLPLPLAPVRQEGARSKPIFLSHGEREAIFCIAPLSLTHSLASLSAGTALLPAGRPSAGLASTTRP